MSQLLLLVVVFTKMCISLVPIAIYLMAIRNFDRSVSLWSHLVQVSSFHSPAGHISSLQTEYHSCGHPTDCINSQCFAELDTTADTLSVPLNHHNVYISINDSNGNDPSRINNIIVTEPHQTLGTFSSHLTTQLLFHFKVINSSVVQPELTITTMDTFSLEFRYGHATSGLILFTACIHHIPLPILNHARSISLARGGFAVVTTAHLLASDTRGRLNSSIPLLQHHRRS